MIMVSYLCKELPNGLRHRPRRGYPRVGGRGQGLGAGKTRSQKNARKCRRIPHVRCTLCWAVFAFQKSLVVLFRISFFCQSINSTTSGRLPYSVLILFAAFI